MSYPSTTKTAVLRDLEAVHAARGAVPAALVRECAADIGCAESTVWAWWRQHRDAVAPAGEVAGDGEPSTGGMQTVHLEVLFASGGNVSLAHRQLMADPETAAVTPSRRTLALWWSNVDAAVRAYATDGAVGLMNNQMRVRHSVDHRNQLWRIDHQEFPVWVLPAGRSSTPVKPWVTTLIDDATRMVMSVLVTVERPDATSVGVALADAVRLKATTLPGVHVGGLPLAVLSDNGGEFRSDQVTGMLRRLGIASKRTYPYMKHLNGKVERVQQTMQHEVAKQLPGYANGAKTLRLRDVYGLDADLISEELLSALLQDWMERYNTERPHEALDAATPLQVWAAQRIPLRQPDMEAVRLAMMPAAKPRKVTADGISFGGQLYTSGELAALRLVGRQVDVRFLPNDDTFIEVFDDDQWLCTCVPVTKLDQAGLDLMTKVRREQYLAARAFQDAARDRRHLAVATATPDHPTLLPLSTTTPASLYGGDLELLELSEADTAGIPLSAPDPFDVVMVGGHETDPWELPAAAGDLHDDPYDDLLPAATEDRP